MGIALNGCQTAASSLEFERAAPAALDGDDVRDTGSHTHTREDRALNARSPSAVGGMEYSMASRRFTRLTNGFSKKLENHAAAVSLYVAHYNLCRWHETIRSTPAEALGLADHAWSLVK